MKTYHYFAAIGVLLILAGFVMIAPMLAQDNAEGATVPARPEVLTSFYDAWVASPHADVSAEAFNHWNEEDDQAIPTSCARCHSTPGYRDYLGADGSEAGVVDEAAPLGTTITCDACHNEATMSLTSVTFPSGVEMTDLGSAARCMVCHQGRESGLSVQAAVDSAGVDQNTVSEDLRFINIHYFAAAATLYGSEVHGGYEFEGKSYQLRSDHVEGYNTCINCHDQHTLKVKVDECSACHEDVKDESDLRDIRMNGSLRDYDGDGNIREGIAGEIETLQEDLYQAMQTYAAEVAGTPLVYDVNAYPYFFADVDGNGEHNEGDTNYATFTPLLLEAAYNYQVTLKDPGGFAHNPKYMIELLYDSIEALDAQVSDPVDMSQMVRNDAGHFDSTAEPFRHWDATGEVDAACTKCHTADGLPFYLDNGGVLISRPPSNSLACTTCHENLGTWDLRSSNEVTFPSGAVLSFGEDEPANLCINCHQGRESTSTVNAAIARADVGDDVVSDALGFRNIHYFAAGATLFGNEAQGAYQYIGKEYSGQNHHTRRFDTCVDCHNEHSLEVRYEECGDCHEALEEDPTPQDVFKIRLDEDYDPVDYDGDGNVEEPINDEITSLRDALLVAIQGYASDTIGTPIGYNGSAYPYFFIDGNNDGVISADEATSEFRYASWTPRLVRAAFNYQYALKDPGAFAHNPDYVLEILYDSIEDIGGPDAVANFNRPPVRSED